MLTRLYRRVMGPLITNARVRFGFLACVALLLLSAIAFVPLGWVKVKMLPFDNKSEFQVIVDMPEGTPLEETARVATALGGRGARGAGPSPTCRPTSARRRPTTSTASCGTTSCAAAPTSPTSR